MNRRRFLGSAGTAAAVSLTGCAALRFTRNVSLDGGSYPQIYYDAANTNHPETEGPPTSRRVYWTTDHHGNYLVNGGNLYLGDSVFNVEDGSESEELERLLEVGFVEDGIVYGASNNEDKLLAFDAETGENVWSSVTTGHLSSLTVTGAEDRIFVKSSLESDGEGVTRLAAFDRSTGERLWIGREWNPSVGPPAVDGGRIFCSVYEDGVYALSVEDGSIEWSVPGESFAYAVSVANGTVYALSVDDSRPGMQAFDAEDGSSLWDRQINATGPGAVSEDTMYLTTHPEGTGVKNDLSEARLVALNAETGETRWDQQAPVATTPTLADGTVYVCGRTETRTGMIAAYDASSGEEQWGFTQHRSPPSDTGPSPIFVSRPVVVDGYLLTPIGNALFALGE